MHSFFYHLLFALTLALPALSAPATSSSYKVFEKLAAPPRGWTALSKPSDDSEMLPLHFMLEERNVDDFYQQVMDLSTPGHALYGSHMTKDQVNMLLRPHDSSADVITAWLSKNGLGDRIERSDTSITVRVSVTEADNLLQADYKYYANEGRDQTVLRTLSYSLPQDLHDHVALVHPTTMFGLRNMASTVRTSSKKTGEGSAANSFQPTTDTNSTFCNTFATPACLKELYKYGGYKSQGLASLGITGYLDQTAIFSDLKMFANTLAPNAQGANFSVISINGGKNPQNETNEDNIGEANLDVQYSLGVAWPVKATFYTTGGKAGEFTPDEATPTNGNEPYLEFLDYILGQDDLPSVITTSYGDDEQTVPVSYQKATCTRFAKLGARGVSVIFSSGDSGPGLFCTSNDGKNTTEFNPTFPATCPFVTSVGALQNIQPEKAAPFSSGGFSQVWPRPSYQEEAVTSYFTNTDTYKPFEKYFNKSGRAFPDVSLQGVSFPVYILGEITGLQGTSASTPVFAGMIALLNDDRLAAGKKPLGFLNPWLYGNAAKAFTDITVGKSAGCTGIPFVETSGADAIIPHAGFKAVKGWDPVTGLGSPDFEKLRSNCPDSENEDESGINIDA